MKECSEIEYNNAANLSTNCEISQTMRSYIICKVVETIHTCWLKDGSAVVKKVKSIRWKFKRRIDKLLEIKYYRNEPQRVLHGK